MRIALVCNDSRGGVQPYVALALGLRRAGHEVRAVAPSDLASMFNESSAGLFQPRPPSGVNPDGAPHPSPNPSVLRNYGFDPSLREGARRPTAALSAAWSPEGGDVSTPMEHGIAVQPLAGSVEAVLRASGGAAERGTIASTRLAMREMPARIGEWTRQTLEACEGVDVVAGGVGGMIMGMSVAEKLGVPFVEAHLQPIGAPTDAYPGVLATWVPSWLGGWGRRLGHRLTEMALWMPFSGAMKTVRRDLLGLSGRPTAADGQPVLYAFSKHVVPVPPSAERERHVTGYWSLPASSNWQPDETLTQFLAKPGPVVSIGFGSMASRDPAALTELVRRAVTRVGARAVLLSGWGGLSDVPADGELHCASALPHDWLFSRVAAIVHHGGAGTTGAALRAGTPSIVVPFTMDQPFWGSRVAALGAGPDPIPRSRLTEDRLARALERALTDEAMRARAAELGARIREEDGVGAAVAVLERVSPAR